MWKSTPGEPVRIVRKLRTLLKSYEYFVGGATPLNKHDDLLIGETIELRAPRDHVFRPERTNAALASLHRIALSPRAQHCCAPISAPRPNPRVSQMPKTKRSRRRASQAAAREPATNAEK
jgi:hypothetical protein